MIGTDKTITQISSILGYGQLMFAGGNQSILPGCCPLKNRRTWFLFSHDRQIRLLIYRLLRRLLFLQNAQHHIEQ